MKTNKRINCMALLPYQHRNTSLATVNPIPLKKNKDYSTVNRTNCTALIPYQQCNLAIVNPIPLKENKNYSTVNRTNCMALLAYQPCYISVRIVNPIPFKLNKKAYKQILFTTITFSSGATLFLYSLPGIAFVRHIVIISHCLTHQSSNLI